MKLKYLLIFLTIISTHSAFGALKPFVTDGCTLFADGTLKRPGLWTHCCEEHDMRYWFGGDQADMDKTDIRLRSCVKDVAGKTWADLIYTGVRAGHTSPVKNKTHWSWGWSTERANTPLTAKEITYIIEELRLLPFESEIIETFIQRNFKNIKAHEKY